MVGQIANNFRGANLSPYLILVVYLNIIQKQSTDKTTVTFENLSWKRQTNRLQYS